MYLPDPNIDHSVRRSAVMRGSALVAVLWLIGILSLAIFAAMTVVSFDTDLMTSRIHGVRARHLAERGVAIAANAVIEPGDPLLEQYFENEGGGFRATIESEGARFNLNAILLQEDRDLMIGLFVDWGIELDDAEMIYDSLADWVDEDTSIRLNGAEIDYYERKGYSNRPFNRPFYDLSEAELVRGFGLVMEARPDWKNWFTIWSSGQLDINEAEPELIAAAVRGSVEAAQELVDRIKGPDGIRFTEDDVPIEDLNAAFDLLGVPLIDRELATPRLTVEDGTDRIVSIGEVGESRWKITLVLRNRTGRPSILMRNEEILP